MSSPTRTNSYEQTKYNSSTSASNHSSLSTKHEKQICGKIKEFIEESKTFLIGKQYEINQQKEQNKTFAQKIKEYENSLIELTNMANNMKNEICCDSRAENITFDPIRPFIPNVSPLYNNMNLQIKDHQYKTMNDVLEFLKAENLELDKMETRYHNKKMGLRNELDRLIDDCLEGYE